MPRLRSHFSSEPLKERLRIVYGWHYNSFEQWFKWECVFALDPVSSWDEGGTEWWLECSKYKGEIGIADMAWLGDDPLFLHLKVLTPGFQRKWIAGPGNSVLSDIGKVRRFRKAPAAAILLVMEHPQESIDLVAKGLPEPDNTKSVEIRLGDVEYNKGEYYREVRARLLYWSNRR
jgi:hypothetical protein